MTEDTSLLIVSCDTQHIHIPIPEFENAETLLISEVQMLLEHRYVQPRNPIAQYH